MGAVTRLRAAGRHLVMGWDSTIARHERLTTSDDLLQCTPRAARRCVLHGACACRTHPDHESDA